MIQSRALLSRSKKILSHALLLTLANLVIRAGGFGLRIFMTRRLGAEAMGVAELASPVFSLMTAFTTSGLSVVTARMTAQALGKHDIAQSKKVLRAGIITALTISLTMIIIVFPFIPFIGSSLLKDSRVIPSIYAYLPCSAILGVAVVYNGHFYGAKKPVTPVVSDLIEQGVRIGLVVGLLSFLPALNVTASCALVAGSATVGELSGLLFTQSSYAKSRKKEDAKDTSIVQEKKSNRLSSRPIRSSRELRALPFKPLISSLAPITFTRLFGTAIRSVNAAVVPGLLMASGLAQNEAITQWGMLAGMAIPLLFFPMVFTSALSTLMVPNLAYISHKKSIVRHRVIYTLLASGFISTTCMVIMIATAPFLSQSLYRQPEVANMLRLLAPALPFAAVQQICSAMLNGLGKEKKSMRNHLIGGFLTLGLTFLLVPNPLWRSGGYILAYTIGTGLGMVLQLISLWRTCRGD